MPAEMTDDAGRRILSRADVERVVRNQYGFTVAEQKRLGGEVDQNVWVRTDNGRQFLLKASAGGVGDDLRWQQTVLEHLERGAPDIPVPRLIPSESRAAVVVVDIAGHPFVVRLLTWLPGEMLAELEELPEYLLFDLGQVAARLTLSLASLPADALTHTHHWDIRNSRKAVNDALSFVRDDADRRCVVDLMDHFDRVRPKLESLPSGVTHHDLNDFNVLALEDEHGRLTISGVLDVNDALFTVRVAEPAIAVAYAMLRRDEPLRAASAVIAGFHSVAPLTEDEIAVVFPLASARLCVNATTWTRRTSESHHPYGHERMRHTWPTLRRIAQIPPARAEQSLRAACGFDRRTSSTSDEKMISQGTHGSVFPGGTGLEEIDLSSSGDFFDDRSWTDPHQVAAGVQELLGERTTVRGFTRHLSTTMLYAEQRQPEARDAVTVQIGVGLLAREGEPVQTPIEGQVLRADGEGPLVLRHGGAGQAQGEVFWTCWWGVEPTVEVGSSVAVDAVLGAVTSPSDDRGLGPIVQVQLLLAETLVPDPPPVRVRPAEVKKWESLTADPARILGLPRSRTVGEPLGGEAVMTLRDRRLARSQRAYYRQPPNLVRGRGVWLYDEYGRAYLDAINNVTHVGHAEPRVTAAVSRQLKKLNTNSRFLYEGIARYAERLVATLPEPLEVVFLVCTGSEANDLALRMARQVTGRSDVVVIDGAYHGNTAAVMGVSPNRYKGPGGRGAPPTTHEVVRPDVYRGSYGRNDPEAGPKYAADVADVVNRLDAAGRPPGAFIAESLMGTAGNIVFPGGYLQGAFQAVREVGALCISDEVQVGFGRLGSHFWGFEAQGVVPDIVTMGKPIGNGHPMAAVVTTREIADAFDDGVKYFNTFGGNPVSCAVGMTVLDIVQEDGLQAHARDVGGYFLEALQQVRTKHELIGDVRGHGMYLGIELVRDRDTKEPAAAEAMNVSELMKDHGVIVYPTGAYDNVLKLKPPMIFDRTHVDLFVSTLDDVLSKAPRG